MNIAVTEANKASNAEREISVILVSTVELLSILKNCALECKKTTLTTAEEKIVDFFCQYL